LLLRQRQLLRGGGGCRGLCLMLLLPACASQDFEPGLPQQEQQERGN
jgi:hypothetical protein